MIRPGPQHWESHSGALSVIIPVKNRPAFLARALRSLIEQRRPLREIIVVDDGSEIDLLATVPELKDELIRYLRQPPSGAAAARNLGAAQANGRYLAFLDSDDEVAPEWAATMLELLESSGSQLVCCGATTRNASRILRTRLPGDLGPAFYRMSGLFLSGTFAIDAQVFRDLDGYASELRANQHNELALRLSRRYQMGSLAAAVVRHALVIHHVHDEERIRGDGAAVLAGTLSVLQKHGNQIALDAQLAADYHAVAALLLARRPKIAASAYHVCRSVVAKPSRLRNWVRGCRILLLGSALTLRVAASKMRSRIGLDTPRSRALEPQGRSPIQRRVLFVIDTLNVGGAERSILQIASCLRETEPSICHIYQGVVLRDDFERAGIAVHSLNIAGKYGLPLAVWRLVCLLRRERPDLVHVALFRAGIIARIACAIVRVPLVDSFVNDPYIGERWERLTRIAAFKLALVRLIDRVTAPLPTHFVAISRTVADSNAAALKVSPHAVSVIYRGREPESLGAPAEGVLEELRTELMLPEHAPVVLNVARLLIRKGQPELLRAFRIVLEKRPGARLLIAGEGPDRKMIERELEHLDLGDSVRLLGSRSDISALLHLADVFAFTSHYEGHGGALIEAMLAARPIVATDTPVHRESIHHGRSGLLVPLGDEGALATALVRMLSDRDRAARLGQAARADALERFTVRSAAEKHDRLYLRLLGLEATALRTS
jgi:glycosyltransferase involved in cell wall biosynthesis